MAEGFHRPTAAGTLVGLAGAMHLAIGAEALGTAVTLLPVLFVLWGLAAIVGVAATAMGLIPRRTALAGGIVLLVVSLVGYVDVYALGLSESALGIDWQPPEWTHAHEGAAGEGHHDADNHEPADSSLLQRLASGHYALPSKIVELLALALLVGLLTRE
jgi:hypothetical protein